MLAMLMDPGSAVSNLKRLSAAGLAGPMGLYESIDYGPSENNPEGEFGVVVFNYMAHTIHGIEPDRIG